MNAYIHIPFCTSLCVYCDFTSFTGQEGKMAAYADALRGEIKGSDLHGPLRTVYFGGGTPSLLAPGQLAAILAALGEKAGFSPEIEVSLEANPETVDGAKLKALRKAGINRLSFGAQASQEAILKKLGRGHDWRKVEEAVRCAREAGFENLNLDLMFGLPGQTLQMFQESLRKTCALMPDHLSLYALQVEEGTPLFQQVASGLALPDEDLVADEYSWAQEFLQGEGLEQYEVSNFARPGKSCRHNWNVWRGEDYWGFGVSAVGTVQGVRQTHGEDLMEYIHAQKEGRPFPIQKEFLPPATLEFEKLMLGLRTKEGVLKSELDDFVLRGGNQNPNRFDLYVKQGWLSFQDNRYRPMKQGFFLLNGIISELLV